MHLNKLFSCRWHPSFWVLHCVTIELSGMELFYLLMDLMRNGVRRLSSSVSDGD